MEDHRKPRLSIVLVCHNTRDDILDCIRSISEAPSIHETEIIVVDNASVDGSPEGVKEHFPDVRLLENTENAGYSRGVNQGIRNSSGEFILILNPDITVKANSLDQLVEYAVNNPNVGIAGSKLLNKDGTIQHSCRKFYTFKTFLYRRTPLGKLFPDSPVLRDHLMLDWDHRSNRDVDWMLGGCMLVRRKAVDDVGLMDERFFLYFEDVDWCYRMKRHGWRVVYVAKSEMMHDHRRESAATVWNRRTFMHLASLIRFYDKWSFFLYRLKSRRHVAKFLVSFAVDLLIINATFLLAYGIRQSLQTVLTKPLFSLGTYSDFILFVNLTSIVILFFTGFYTKGGDLAGASLIADRLLRAIKASSIAYLVVTASTFLTQSHIYSRVLVTIYFLLLGFFLTAGRYALHVAYRSFQRGAYDLKRAIIVGRDDLARRVGDQFRTFPEIGYDLVGYVLEPGDESSSEAGVLGNDDELPRLVREHRVSDVFLVGRADPLPIVSRLLIRLADSPVTVRVVSELSTLTLAQGRAEEFLNIPVLRFARRTLVGYHPVRKRLLDLCLSFTGLVVTFPLFLSGYLLLILSGIRPIIRSEEIRHFHGERKRLPRFAVPEKGEGGAAGALLRNLFRAAPAAVGIPSLYAVLTGRFSLVGPIRFDPGGDRSLDEWQRLLTTMKPGICDAASVAENPWVPFRDPVGLNVYYVQYWSIGLDLQIVIRELVRSFQNPTGRSSDKSHE